MLTQSLNLFLSGEIFAASEFVTVVTQAACLASHLILGCPAGAPHDPYTWQGSVRGQRAKGGEHRYHKYSGYTTTENTEAHVRKCWRNEPIIRDPLAPLTKYWNIHGQKDSVELRQQLSQMQSQSKSQPASYRTDEPILRITQTRQGPEQAKQCYKRRTTLEDLQYLISGLPIKYNHQGYVIIGVKTGAHTHTNGNQHKLQEHTTRQQSTEF